MFMLNKKFKILATVVFSFLVLVCFADENKYEVRAAIDIGSGATKLKVAKVDLKTQKIEQILVDESFTVQYQEALEKSPDGVFDEQVMQTGLEALKKSQALAQKHQAKKTVAVATASFRKAANIHAFIDRIFRETGIEVHIIDQQLEGILGFQATASQLDADPKHVIVWDIGGGSYQFSTLDPHGNVQVYRGVDASIPFKNHIIKHIKKHDPNLVTTPNPLTQVELKDATNHAHRLSKKVDDLFKKKISSSRTVVVGIGNIFAYGIYPLIGKKSSFTQQELFDRVQRLEGKTDEQLGGHDYVNVAVTNPVLVLGFMKSLGIQRMDIINVNNADGALLHSAFWKKSA